MLKSCQYRVADHRENISFRPPFRKISIPESDFLTQFMKQTLFLCSKTHFRTSGIVDRISGKHFRTSDSVNRISGTPFRTSGSVNRISGRHFLTSGSVDRISGRHFRTSGSVNSFSGTHFRTSGSAYRISGRHEMDSCRRKPGRRRVDLIEKEGIRNKEKSFLKANLSRLSRWGLHRNIFQQLLSSNRAGVKPFVLKQKTREYRVFCFFTFSVAFSAFSHAARETLRSDLFPDVWR